MSVSEDLFELWAPAASPWSVWAKPVLFADLQETDGTSELLQLPAAENFPQPHGIAVIVDVAGAEPVRIGLVLARMGYQPVPLFNSHEAKGMVVDMGVIANWLGFGAKTLRECALKSDAPPAFLLNADRLDGGGKAQDPGRYDNRWCVVPQDMPSARFLADAGITKVVLVAETVRDDLSHILCRYQEAGIAILRTSNVQTAPMPITVTKPRFFYRSFVYRLQAYIGLRRNSAGGFGAIVPDPGSSGGYYGGFGG